MVLLPSFVKKVIVPVVAKGVIQVYVSRIFMSFHHQLYPLMSRPLHLNATEPDSMPTNLNQAPGHLSYGFRPSRARDAYRM